MISALRLLLLFLMTTLAGQVCGVEALSVEKYGYDAAINSSVEAEASSDQQKHTYDRSLILLHDIGNVKSFSELNLQNRYFIAFAGDFLATKSEAQMGEELAGKIGKHRVSARTGGKKQIDIDLKGKSHFDKPSGKEIETPHVHESNVNVGPGGSSLSGKTTRAATKQDIRTARKIMRRR